MLSVPKSPQAPIGSVDVLQALLRHGTSPVGPFVGGLTPLDVCGQLPPSFASDNKEVELDVWKLLSAEGYAYKAGRVR